MSLYKALTDFFSYLAGPTSAFPLSLYSKVGWHPLLVNRWYALRKVSVFKSSKWTTCVPSHVKISTCFFFNFALFVCSIKRAKKIQSCVGEQKIDLCYGKVECKRSPALLPDKHKLCAHDQGIVLHSFLCVYDCWIFPISNSIGANSRWPLDRRSPLWSIIGFKIINMLLASNFLPFLLRWLLKRKHCSETNSKKKFWAEQSS